MTIQIIASGVAGRGTAAALTWLARANGWRGQARAWRALGMGLLLGLAGVVGMAGAAHAGQTLQQYADMCTREIGQIPAFNCNSGTVIPITVNGKEPEKYTKGMSCDRPSLLKYEAHTDGQCTPYSRISDLSYVDPVKGAVQITAFCRREWIRPSDSTYYDEVDIVLHSVKTGATCWFHSEYKPGTTTGFDASRVPPPNEKQPPPGKVSANQFWWQPAATAKKDCGGCHDADPFMFSPWIGQKWNKVPTDPFGKYHHLGPDFAKWRSSSISTRDNTCVGCHRIGNRESCKSVIAWAAGLGSAPPGSNELARHYPLSHWMPVDNNQSPAFWQNVHQKSVKELLTCCNDPNNPICTITPITHKAPITSITPVTPVAAKK
jgi:hypothetical protein